MVDRLTTGARDLRLLPTRLPILLCAIVIATLSGCDSATSSASSENDESAASSAERPASAPTLVPERQEDGQLTLEGPQWEGWRPVFEPAAPPNVPGLGAEAYHFKGIIYDRAAKDAKSTGIVRRGRRIAVQERVFGSGCEGGGWYRVDPYGFVCTKDGFWVSKEARDPEPDSLPHPEARIPYRYAKVVTKNAPRFFSIPSANDLTAARAASAGDTQPPEVVEKMMDGIFLLALRDAEKLSEMKEQEEYQQTVRGRYVRTEDIELRPNVPMQGEQLGETVSLPLAFVWKESARLYRGAADEESGMPKNIGTASKHARFPVGEDIRVGDKAYVQSAQDDFLVMRSDVRVARKIARPERIPENKKWIHVHLPEQTLVAYEGDTPVLATLVSSGQEGFETPAGVYQVQHKYLSVTMNGPDPDEGFYEVEEVPWTMYYFESFALHGAYWHNDFGKVRSHGCTNIPPADARWLYYWSDPKVPAGWHAATRSPGTYVYITNAEL